MSEGAVGTAAASSRAATPRRWLAVFGVLAALAVAAVVLFVAVRRVEPTAQAAASVQRDVPHLDGSLIRFTPEFAQRAGIKLAAAEVSPLSPLVTVTGTVNFDPERTAAVGARIAGRVRTVKRFEGDEVKPGDVLAEVESVELGQAQAALVSARAHVDVTAANEKRERQLADAKVSAERDAELARAAAAAARADLIAADQRVRALGGGQGGGLGILLLRSPIAGKVVERKVSQGQSVEPTLTAFRVADLGRLWVELAVFERELGAVRRGDAVEISPQTNTHMVLKGRIAHVGDVIDLETRSAGVRVVVENPDESLRPGQSVLAKIHTQIAVAPALVVPRDAVVTVDGRPTVFVAHDDTSVEPRPVVLGAKDAARVEISSGLKAGERIVVQGVFALKSELFR